MWKKLQPFGLGGLDEDGNNRALSKTLLEGYNMEDYCSIITMGLVYLTTGSIVQTLLVGIPETILKVFLYILHEMAWERWE
jgi:hypothetical protein